MLIRTQDPLTDLLEQVTVITTITDAILLALCLIQKPALIFSQCPSAPNILLHS